MTDLYTPPPVENRSSKPPGAVPRKLQAWTIGAIALVMMLVIAFSGRNAPTPTTPVPRPEADVDSPDAARIREYRQRIEEQLQRLMQEQARLAQAKGALGLNVGTGGNATPAAPGFRSAPVYTSVGPPRESWIALDRQKRLYESRYAPSIALTRREPPVASRLGLTPEGVASTPSQQTGPAAGAVGQVAAPDGPKTYPLLEGTIIETVLTNRLDGTFSGPLNCLVTTAVYSRDRRHVLIPQGSRVLGSVQQVEAFGQQRLAVSFHRLIRPDGSSFELKKPPGLSQVGETGLLDQVNRHYGRIFGVSLAIGAIAGLSQINTASGANASTTDVYRQGVASSLSQSSLNILDRFLNVLPTFTIREGQRIKVYLTADMGLPAAEPSTQERPGGPS